MCLFTSLVFLGPRVVIFIWWLAQPVRWQAAFSSWIWPALGFFFLPWTTVMYMIVAPSGVVGLEWLWLAIALFADIGTYVGGAYTNRGRLSRRAAA